MVLWEQKHGKRSVGGQADTFVDLLEADTGVPRDCLPSAMDERVGWRTKTMGRLTEVDLVEVVLVVVVVVVMVVEVVLWKRERLER